MKKNKLGNYFKKYTGILIFYVFVTIFASVVYAVNTIVLANAIGEVTAGNYDVALRFFVYSLILTLLNNSSWLVNDIMYSKYSGIITADISLDLTKRCFELSSSTFSENNSGTFLQRIMNDPATLIGKLDMVLMVVTDILSAAVVIVYVVTLNWIIGLIYSVLLTLLSILETYRLKRRKKNRTNEKKVEDETYALMTEIIKSERDVKTLNMEDRLHEMARNQVAKKRKLQFKTRTSDNIFGQIRNVLIKAVSLLILIIGIFMMQKGLLTIAIYILLFSYKDQLYGFVWSFGSLADSFSEINIATKRMFSLFDEELFPTEKFGSVELKNVKGKIQFKNVKFAYEEVKEIEKDNKKKSKSKKLFERVKQKTVLKDLSLSIKPNTTVAFVGKSGSGKSTILSLIAKLIETDSGAVLIDNYDIKQLSKESIRDNISLINQFPYIFDMTIKENLSLVKKDATDEEIWDALERASFDKDVKAMPNGIDTKVGETGVKLSGGQRQRLAIARALLKESKIIIFDESTSSLDNFAQSEIQKSIENLKGQHTVVIVAHRLSTIKNVDTIYFLNEGKIVDKGSFEELYNNNQTFQDMFLIENI